MAKLLYPNKICLFESAILQLPQVTIATNSQLSKLKRFVTFATMVYSPWWFSCNSAINSPFNDLKLYQNLLAFAKVAASAIKALERHLWYLTAEMIPLSLFSSLVPSPVKIARQTSCSWSNHTSAYTLHSIVMEQDLESQPSSRTSAFPRLMLTL